MDVLVESSLARTFGPTAEPQKVLNLLAELAAVPSDSLELRSVEH